MTRKWIAGIAALALLALLLSGCASKPERYESAMQAYRQGEYAKAAKAFGKLRGYEDADALAEKCRQLTAFQDAGVGKQFVDGWLAHAFPRMTTQAINQMSLKERQARVEDPVGFVDWAMDFAEGKGERLGFAVAYPAIRQALDDDMQTGWFWKQLDAYVAQLLVQYGFYRENPALAAFVEAQGGLWIDNAAPLRADFCQWIEADPSVGESLDILAASVEPSEEVSFKTMCWTRALLREYYGAADYRAAHPQPQRFLLAAEDGSEEENLNNYELGLLLRVAPEWQVANDPDDAAVFIYYRITRKTVTYVSEGGKALHGHVGTATFSAADAATGETIAEVTFEGQAPEQTYGSGGENYLYDPEISDMEKDRRFLKFIDAVRGHMQPENREE